MGILGRYCITMLIMNYRYKRTRAEFEYEPRAKRPCTNNMYEWCRCNAWKPWWQQQCDTCALWDNCSSCGTWKLKSEPHCNKCDRCKCGEPKPVHHPQCKGCQFEVCGFEGCTGQKIKEFPRCKTCNDKLYIKCDSCGGKKKKGHDQCAMCTKKLNAAELVPCGFEGCTGKKKRGYPRCKTCNEKKIHEEQCKICGREKPKWQFACSTCWWNKRTADIEELTSNYDPSVCEVCKCKGHFPGIGICPTCCHNA